MAGWSIAQNPLLLPRDQPCNVLGNFSNRLTHCQQKGFTPGHIMCISQGYTGGWWRSENIWKRLLCSVTCSVYISCSCPGLQSCISYTLSAACKIHDIVLLFASAFTFMRESEMGIEWPWVPDTSLFLSHPQTAAVWPLSTRCILSDTCNNSVNGTKIELTLKADFTPLEGWKPWMSPVPSGSSESLFCSLRHV